MHAGRSMSAAHILDVNAQNPADNRSRQPKGAPASIGGQFATEAPKPEASASTIAASTLQAATIAKLHETYQLAERIANQAEEHKQKTAVALAKVEILNVWPTATKAILFRHYDDSYDEKELHVERVLDADGAVLFDRYGRSGQETLLADGFLADVTEVDYTDYDFDDHYAELEDRGAVSGLDLTKIDTDRRDAADIIGVDTLDSSSQYSLLLATANNVGQVLIPANTDMFNIYLDEEPDTLGISENTGAQLDAKYGSREAALKALIDTPAYLDFDDEAPEAVFDSKVVAMRKAIEQALAAETPA